MMELTHLGLFWQTRMDRMYKLEVMINTGEIRQYIAERDGLFDLCWILEQSKNIRQFKVEWYRPEHFGWGDFEKWINEFTWDWQKF
jgi:hypothetical protein